MPKVYESARARNRLPNCRAAETFDLEVAGQHYTATVGRFAELFISNGKAGSDSDVSARDSAIVCSLALQFGADLETIRRALCRDSRGNASGPLGEALDRIAAEDER
jgi:hypothetical protein